MLAITGGYIGLRTYGYRPPTTSFSVGAAGNGVPRPSTAKRITVRASTPSPAASSAAPTPRSASGAPRPSQPVSQYGTRPPITPGCPTRNTRVPTAAPPRVMAGEYGDQPRRSPDPPPSPGPSPG